MIRSRRIHWVEAPEASAPGTPTVAAEPTKRSGSGIRVKLIVGAVLLLVAAVVVALVIPALVGGTSSSDALVDINSEPKSTWTYQWAGESNPEFLADTPGVTRVGDTRALVWPVFDLAAYGDAIGTSLGWYEGYDQQYDDGYAAGLEFRVADDAYHNDTFPYTVPPANEENYFPDGVYGNYNEFLGFQDGFYDAAGALGAGANKRERPVDPGYLPVVTLVNAETGEAEWSHDLSAELAGLDYSSAISAHDIEGSSAIAVIVSSQNSDGGGTSLLTLNRENGKVLSSVTNDGPIDVAAFDGDIIVSSADETGENVVIGRYPVNRVDEKPRWEAESDGTPYLLVDGGFVMAYGSDAGAIFTGSDGQRAGWGDDATFSVFYQFVGDQLVRSETQDGGGDQSIEGWSVDGVPTWKEAVSAPVVTILDEAILTANLTSAEPVDLQRVNPADGSTMWSKPYGPQFDGFVGLHGSSLLLSRGSTIVIVDLGTGEERVAQTVGDFRDVYEGQHQYYVPAGAELVAYSYTSEGAIWSLSLREGESITTLGNRLVLVDADTLSLHGLAAK